MKADVENADKKVGLYNKYEVKKLSNPDKRLDCIVLEFDDENSRKGIEAFADAVELDGYQQLADDLRMKLRTYAGDAKSVSHPLLQFFSFRHLPADKQIFSKPFCVMAYWMCRMLPDNFERTEGLRKLLEAKDCAVRSTLYKEPQE